jgi:hypothetical protein
MIVMERDPKMALNQNPDARTGPQLVRPAVGFRSLQQQGFQATMLFGGQARLWTAMRFSSQAVRLAGHCKPTVNGSAIGAVGASHHLGAFTPIDRLHRMTPSPLQFRGGSKRSAHIQLEHETGKTIHWPRSWQ